MLRRAIKLAFFSAVRTEILQGQCAACYSRKETIAQLMTENNVENFIYVPSTEQTKPDYVNKRIAAAEEQLLLSIN